MLQMFPPFETAQTSSCPGLRATAATGALAGRPSAGAPSENHTLHPAASDQAALQMLPSLATAQRSRRSASRATAATGVPTANPPGGPPSENHTLQDRTTDEEALRADPAWASA